MANIYFRLQACVLAWAWNKASNKRSRVLSAMIKSYNVCCQILHNVLHNGFRIQPLQVQAIKYVEESIDTTMSSGCVIKYVMFNIQMAQPQVIKLFSGRPLT